MTPEDAIELGLKTLAAAGVLDYCVCVVEMFPEKPECFGLHRRHERMIYLSASANGSDEEMKRTIDHEVAHALCPNDKEHGLPWQVALERIQNLNAAGFQGQYRKQEDE